MNPLSYRKAAVESASPVGLVIMLYDTLVGDLQRAIDAINRGDVAERCRQSNHAFLVLQYLESNIDTKNGGETATQLVNFYGHIRAMLLQAQFQQSVDLLKKQIDLVLDVRSAWQSVDTVSEKSMEPAQPAMKTSAAYAGGAEEVVSSNWSA